MNGLLSQLTRETTVIRQTLALDAEGLNTGLAIEDEVKGFAAVGFGKLAPLDKNVQVSHMVEETGGWRGRSRHRDGGEFRPPIASSICKNSGRCVIADHIINSRSTQLYPACSAAALI